MISLLVMCATSLVAQNVSADHIISQLPSASSKRLEHFADVLSKNPKVFSEVTQKALGTRLSENAMEESHTLDHAVLQKKISIRCSDTTGNELLLRWGEESGISVVCSLLADEVVPLFSVFEVASGDVLSMILAGCFPGAAFFFNEQTQTVHIGSAHAIAQQKQQFLRDAIVTRSIPLPFAPWNEECVSCLHEVWRLLGGALAHCVCNEQTRSVICSGSSSLLQRYTALLESLYGKHQQVHIEARMIMMSHAFEQKLGMQWRAQHDPQQNQSYNSIHIGDTVSGSSAVVTATGMSLPVLFASATAATNNILATLDAAEQNSDVITLLKPSIITTNNQMAEMMEGESIPIEQMVEESVEGRLRNVRSATYKDVGVQLKVTPVIQDGNRVLLSIYLEHSSHKRGVSPHPIVVTSRARSQVSVVSGKTIVIGGLLKREQKFSRGIIPLLSQLPLIGWLFSNQQSQNSYQHIMLVITPTILS